MSMVLQWMYMVILDTLFVAYDEKTSNSKICLLVAMVTRAPMSAILEIMQKHQFESIFESMLPTFINQTGVFGLSRGKK